MKNKKYILVLSIFIIIVLSGCLDFFKEDSSTTYSSQATELSYKISYGYRINCSGNGFYQINYDCDKPELIKGPNPSIDILNNNYTEKKNIATFNDMISWNITKTGKCLDYELGIYATVSSETLLVNDLTGKDALSLSDIKNSHSDLIKRYCKPQGNKTFVFIDPNNSIIKNKAEDIYKDAKTNNSFLIAKELFIWLKQNTQYKQHLINNNVQPADLTMDIKTGDCDDLTYLYLSMCKSIKIPCRFIRGLLVYENTAVPHAWAEIFVGGDIGDGGWIPVECAGERKNPDEIDIEVHQNFAVESADHLRLFKDDGSNLSINISLSGISYMKGENIDIQTPEFFTDIYDYKEHSLKKLYVDENDNRIFK